MSSTSDVPPPPHSSHHDEPGPQDSDSQTSTSTSSPVIVYRPPTVISILRTAAINLVLPFINGLMLGFGELFAHEIAFRLGWSGTRVFPLGRRTIGPGVEIRRNPTSNLNSTAANDRRRVDRELQHTASLE